MALEDKYIENNTLTYDPAESVLIFTDPIAKVRDRDWVESSYMADLLKQDTEYLINIFNSTASYKFQSTGIGEHISVNCPYSFTRYADVPVEGRMRDHKKMTVKGADHKLGMGHYYSEAIDDNNKQTTLFMTFGVPRFNSMFNFLSTAVDYKEAVIANEGRYPYLFDFGRVLGAAAIFISFPPLAILLYAGTLAAKLAGLFVDDRYYTLKQTMHTYWSSANTIVNFLSTERGVVVPFLINTNSKNKNRTGRAISYTKEGYTGLRELMPDLFTEDNAINMFAIATRMQRIVNAQIRAENEEGSDYIANYTVRQVEKAIDPTTGRDSVRYSSVERPEFTGTEYLDYLDESVNGIKSFQGKEPNAQETHASFDSYESVEIFDNNDPDRYDGTYPNKAEEEVSATGESGGYFQDMWDSMYAGVQRGGEQVAFTVEYVGSSSDSFSNETKDIPVKDKLNSVGGAARDIRFSLSGGNILGETIDAITNGIKDTAAGTLDGFTAGLSNVIAGLIGGGYMSFPKMWSDSSMTLATHTFKMRLGGPYGNQISNIVDKDIPLALILAGMLPLGTGKSSYTSPFLCKAYMKGVLNLDFGMITSVTVAKAVGNLGYDSSGAPSDLEVSFTITDFSDIMSAPVNSGMFGALDLGLNYNSTLNKYLSVIAGRDLRTNTFLMPRLLLNLSRAKQGLATNLSSYSLGLLVGETIKDLPIVNLIPDNTITSFSNS